MPGQELCPGILLHTHTLAALHTLLLPLLLLTPAL
jgi:hypothetical protein